MFPEQTNERRKSNRLVVVGLLVLSVTALVITVWMMIDFLREQSIVADLMKKLPSEAQGDAKILADELRWQFRLILLVVLNVVVTGIAVLLLWRAYHASQQSLRDFKVLAADVLSGMEQGVITTDPMRIVTSINCRGLELLGTDVQSIGKPIQQLNALPLNDYLDDWLSDHHAHAFREFMIGDSPQKIIHASFQVLNDSQGGEAGYVLQLREVTELVLLEKQMRRMERYMGLGALAGGLHHEIKNPLAALSLHVQLLEEQLESDGTSDENKLMLSIIRTEVGRIGGVLEGFRNFALSDDLNTANVDLAAMLKRQVELMRPQATQENVEIKLEGDQEVILEIDQVRLEQVFLNLIVNGIEAMPDGGTLTITIRQEGESVVVEVTDTGIGIPENLKDKIFDPYFSTKSSGTGLGLAFGDKIVRLHRGSLEFRTSTLGTTFEVTLPWRKDFQADSINV